MLILRLLTLGLVTVLLGCVNPGGGGKDAKGGTTASTGGVDPYSFFSKLRIKGAKNLKAAGNDEAVGLAKGNYAYKMKFDKSLEQLIFTVEEKDTGRIYDAALPVMKMKRLSSRYTGIKFAPGKVGVMDNIEGEIFDMENTSFEEMQIRDANLYHLNTNSKQLYLTDMTAPVMEAAPVNKLNRRTANTNMPTGVFSMFNDIGSPFRFLAYNQVGASDDFTSPTLLFLPNNFVAAMSGPEGGKRVTLFDENSDYAYDCQLGTNGLFTNVPGGMSGGVIQNSRNYEVYQVQIGNSPNCVNPGVMGCGDMLQRLEFNTAGNCVSTTTLVDLGRTSHFRADGSDRINFKTDYRLDDETKYILNKNGFLKTYPDGSGGVTMTWVDLDLSAVPSNSTATNPTVIVYGDKVYYLRGSIIYEQNLMAGQPPTIFAPVQPTSFDIVNGALYFTLSTGLAYVIPSPGAQPELLDNAKIDLTDSVVKF